MSVNLSPLGGAGWQFLDNSGNVLSGGLLYTYSAGTTTPLTTYQDATGTTANANPVVLDAAGRVSGEVWLTAGLNYKLVLKTSTGTTLWTADNISGGTDAAASVLAQLAASGGSSLIGFLQSGTGAVATTVQSKLRETVSVLDFGADPTGATDSTVAFQNALNAAKGANNTGVGRTVFALHVPSYPGGFYKISDTLVIDGTHGLHLYGDGALTERESTDTEGVLRWYGASSKPVIQVKGQSSGSFSNPNFMIKISDLTISGYATPVTPTSGVPATLALSGIHIGNLDTQNTDTLVRNLSIDNVRITDCRFGIWSGNPDALNTDHASVYLTNSYIVRCPQAGICWGTGNAIFNATGNHVAQNGWGALSFPADDYSAQIGANVYVASGYVDLVSITTAGDTTYKPTSADIYQGSGRCSIINAWSDTEGYFYYQGSASSSGTAPGYHVGQITGVRHFNGSFTIANTPSSMRIVVPGTVVSSCLVYGDIEVVSGLSGRPIFMGINFARSGATFIGSGVETQRSLINIGNSGNNAQVLLGGANSGVPLTHKGNKVPNILAIGGVAASQSVVQYLGPASTSSGWQIQGEESLGQFRLLVNGYFSGTDAATPLNVNRAMFYIVVGGSTHLMRVWSYDPSGSAAEVALSSFTSQGGFLSANLGGSRSEVTFQAPLRSAAPSYTSGDYWEGSIYYNTSTNKLQVNTGGSTWVDLH